VKSNLSKIILAVFNLIGFSATVFINGLANALPINGKNTGAISDSLPNLFAPAGFIFSIWGLIYIMLLVFSIYQLITVFIKDEKQSEFHDKISFYFLIASAANCCWILAWHFELIVLSLVIMLILFTSLLIIYLRLGIGDMGHSSQEKYFVHVPFSIYLGWITVAAIANFTAAFVSIGWKGFGLNPEIWTVAVIIVAVLISAGMLFRKKDIYFNIVIIWALIGIAFKRALFHDAQAVYIASLAGIIILTVLNIIQYFRKKVY
jgi:hypothetical protein